MKDQVYNFKLNLNWKIIGRISQIDRFDASWASVEKIEGKSLRQLRLFATIQSVGSSTRIEGSKIDDKGVEQLINKIEISKLEDRDSQEVVGYFNVLELLIESYKDIEVRENSIKNLHNHLLKHSIKDKWHKGDYKQHVNAVQAILPDGSKQIIFKTSEPGYPTETAMSSLLDWYLSEQEVHPLISCAAFVYDFLSIHPFQDGNGRLSRLLTTFLLLKKGYNWIQYVSFEHEIENNKKAYYKVLRNCQAQRPNEDITEWIDFFLDSLLNIQNKLERKLEYNNQDSTLTPNEKELLTYLGNNPGSKSGQLSSNLRLSKPTIKRILTNLLSKELINKYGRGAGTNYTLK